MYRIQPQPSGFTLIEVLVVVVIVGVLSTLAVLSLSSADASRYARLDVDRFSARITSLCQQGLLLNDSRAVSIIEDRFTAMRPEQGEWVAYEPLFEVSPQVRWALYLDGEQWFPPDEPGPVLWCDGTGEWSPFVLHFIARDDSAHYELEATPLGQLSIELRAVDGR